MTERLLEKTRKLEFSALDPGDELAIVTGQDLEAWRYDFRVQVASRWPLGSLTATNPAGETTAPIDFELHGCGRGTTRAQNPVQTQERGFTPYYDGLITGHFLWGRFASEPGRAIFDKPGQEISEITHSPYRSNTILGTLGSHAGAMSVREIVEAIEDNTPALEERDIRQTLKNLVSAGRIVQLQKKVLRYELTT